MIYYTPVNKKLFMRDVIFIVKYHLGCFFFTSRAIDSLLLLVIIQALLKYNDVLIINMLV